MQAAQQQRIAQPGKTDRSTDPAKLRLAKRAALAKHLS